MAKFGSYDTHARLVTRMADALGVDLDEEIQRGRAAPEDERGRIYRCLSCTEPDLCAKFLEATTTPARRAPRYCRNKDELERLAGRVPS